MGRKADPWATTATEEIRAALAGSHRLPLLWPDAAERPARVARMATAADGRIKAIGLIGGRGLEIIIASRHGAATPGAPPQRAAGSLVPRGADEHAAPLPVITLSGVVCGADVAFAACADDDRWAAAADLGQVVVTITGDGEAPKRLALVELPVTDVVVDAATPAP